MNILEIIQSNIDQDIEGSIRKLKLYKIMELEKNILENNRKGYNKKDRLKDVKLTEPVYKKIMKEEGLQSLFKSPTTPETVKVNNFINEYKDKQFNFEKTIGDKFGSLSSLSKYNQNKILNKFTKLEKKSKNKTVINAGYDNTSIEDLVTQRLNQQKA